ncbi:unnamed protein product, partial [Durusdinium trenchii]
MSEIALDGVVQRPKELNPTLTCVLPVTIRSLPQLTIDRRGWTTARPVLDGRVRTRPPGMEFWQWWGQHDRVSCNAAIACAERRRRLQ